MKQPYYIAPEVIKKNYNEKCDVWSSGVILYILLCGSPPFSGSSSQEVLKKVQQAHFNIETGIWKSVSEEAKQLVSKMLEVDVEKRYSAEEALCDPWISSSIKQAKIENPTVFAAALKNLQHLKVLN